MERSDKLKLVEEIKDKLGKSRAVFLVNYQGINVANMNQLRKEVKKAEGEVKVVKNTLARIALDETQIPRDDQILRGQNAFAFSYLDPVEVAKVLDQFKKKTSQLEIKGGWLGGRLVPVGELERLATLPSREVLLGQVVGGIAAPISGLVGVLQGLLRNLVWTLKAIEKEKREKGEQS
ncbi:MAG: large subunit ribosomal protein [Candidatus Atribacteria bacterium]|nr:large subunit ribosomal protein [Candidatus Atribacteria bacterium]